MTRLAPIEAHRLWAPYYDAQPNALLALEARIAGALFSQYAPLSPGMRAIDIACGTGRWMRELETREVEVWGFDACAEMISMAGPFCKRMAVADAICLPIASATADLAICSFALDYLPDLTAALSEMARVVRRGGCVLISDMHPDRKWQRSFRAGSEVFEAAHFNRPLKAIEAAAASTGLSPIACVEAPFGEAERPIFDAAGKEMPSAPAIWAAIWTKPCS